MLVSSIFTEFVELFTQMSIVTFICLMVGLILIIIEFFQPARGLLASCGVLLVCVGIVIRLLCGGTFAMMFFLTFFCVGVTCVAHMIMLNRHKKDWLTHSLALSILDEESQKNK